MMSCENKLIEPLQKEREKNWFQVIAILIVSIEGLISGALAAWSSPFMVKIAQDKTNYNITEDEASLFPVLNSVGLLLLPPFLVPLTNKIGRKHGLILAAFPFLISWITKAFATSKWGFYFARSIIGLGDALMMCVAPMYIGEISSPSVRGLWGNAFFIAVIFGSFITNVIGIYCSVVVTSVIFIILQIIHLVLLFFIPETPYYYLANDKDREARESLQTLRRKSDVEDELKQLKADVSRQLSETGTWMELVTIKTNRRALSIAIFLRMAQIFSGVFLFVAYTQYIFQKVRSQISTETSTIIYSAFNFGIYAAAVFGSHKLGRRKSLLLSLAGNFIVFTAEAVYFLVDKNYPEVNLEPVQWFPLAGLIMFLIFSSIGIGPIPTLMEAELFSASVKSKGISCVVVSFGILIIGVNNFFYYLNIYTGLYGPFLMFAFSSFLSWIVTYFAIPETKGRTLEQIQQMLKPS